MMVVVAMVIDLRGTPAASSFPSLQLRFFGLGLRARGRGLGIEVGGGGHVDVGDAHGADEALGELVVGLGLDDEAHVDGDGGGGA